MGVGSRVESHKSKLKKETSDDTFRRLQTPGTPEGHRPMKSHFNVIKKCRQKVSKQGDVDYDKHTDSVKKPYNKNEETGNFRNEIHSGVIDTLNGHIIHVLFEMASNYYHVLCNHLAC